MAAGTKIVYDNDFQLSIKNIGQMLDLVEDLTCLNVILLNHLPLEPLFQVMNEGKVFKHLLCQQKNPAMTSSTFFSLLPNDKHAKKIKQLL